MKKTETQSFTSRWPLGVLMCALCAAGTEAEVADLCNFLPAEVADPATAIAPIYHESGWTGERDLEGYLYNPSYEPNVVSFNRANIPFMRIPLQQSGNQDIVGVQSLEVSPSACQWNTQTEGQAGTTSVAEALKHIGWAPNPDPRNPGHSLRDLRFTFDQRVVFDDDDNAYTFVTSDLWTGLEIPTIAFSRAENESANRSWTAFKLDDHDWSGGRMQPRSFHGTMTHPPLIVVGKSRGGAESRLGLVVPHLDDEGELQVPAAIVLDPLGAGGINRRFAVSSGHRTFIVWGSKTLPTEAQPRDPDTSLTLVGTPSYIQIFDHETGSLKGEPFFLGFAGGLHKGNIDMHNDPTIDIDSEGYLHVVLGAHHDSFLYLKSKHPVDSEHFEISEVSDVEQWTDPFVLGGVRHEYEDPLDPADPNCQRRCAQYTYANMVVDAKDNLHVFSRWSGKPYRESNYYMRLAYLRKPAGAEEWEQRKTLVRPFRTAYSHWYQNSAVDRLGRIFIAYITYGDCLKDADKESYENKYGITLEVKKSCTGTGTKYSNVLEQEPVVMMSDDEGVSWRLATTVDFAAGVFDVCTNGCPYAALQPAIDATAPGDTLKIAQGTYVGSVTIDSSVSLEGFGNVVIDAQGADRALEIATDAEVTLTGISIQGAQGTAGIVNRGDLALSRVSVSSSSGTHGGIYNIGALTVDDSKIEENTALCCFGGGITNIGELTVRNSVIQNNQGYLGGGVHNSFGTTLIEGSDVIDNHATSLGGGYSNHNFGGTVTLMESNLLGNSTDTGASLECYDVNPGNC